MLSLSEIKDILNTKNQNGFSLVIALFAILILMALGFLAISVPTSDLQITTRIVGEKKALIAAETGINMLSQSFTPDSTSGVSEQVVDSSDPSSIYSISNATRPTTGADTLPLKGYAIGGGQQWGQMIFNVRVTGENTNYGSQVQIDVGMGYGPVEITTMFR
ncbi:MAG: hypothetical protein APR62_04995 [Smithella sp. SDB]|nr:MAG: hypothetical protein APR62_04995 [Smithella sp. SDB]